MNSYGWFAVIALLLVIIGSLTTGRPSDSDTTIKLHRDGTHWCAKFGDFENLQVSPAGFGTTEIGAIIDLYRNRDHQSELELMRDLTDLGKP